MSGVRIVAGMPISRMWSSTAALYSGRIDACSWTAMADA